MLKKEANSHSRTSRSSFSKKSQAAMEYILVVGIAFIIAVPMMYMVYSYTTGFDEEVTTARMSKIGDDIITEAETVYYRGVPSRRTLTVDIPKGVQNAIVTEDTNLVFLIGDEDNPKQLVKFSPVKLWSLLTPFDMAQGKHYIIIDAMENNALIYSGDKDAAFLRWCAYDLQQQIEGYAIQVLNNKRSMEVQLTRKCEFLNVTPTDFKTMYYSMEVDKRLIEYVVDMINPVNGTNVAWKGLPSKTFHFLYETNKESLDDVPNVYVQIEEPFCRDYDGDNYDAVMGSTQCPKKGFDCNEGMNTVNPGAPEVCDNGIDDNCDTSIDEGTCNCGNELLDLGEDCDNSVIPPIVIDSTCEDLNYGTGKLACGDSCKYIGCTNIPVCGNHIFENGEECDDGNLLIYDGCDQYCKLEIPGPPCGDKIVTKPMEQCDDGNLNRGDGCDPSCQTEQINVCDNGIVESYDDIIEDCDDGNTNNFDACPNDCIFSVCGDNVLEGLEECDDGERLIGDGCDDYCMIEPICNNGIQEGDEECDDGNIILGDGCDLFCKVEFCGDGFHDIDGHDELPNTGDEVEECDDGCLKGPTGLCEEEDDGDGCSSTCEIESMWSFRNADIGNTWSSPALSEDGSTIYIISGQGILYALSILNPKDPKWSFDSFAAVGDIYNTDTFSSPTVIGNNIYYGLTNGRMYKLHDDGNHATMIWNYETAPSSAIYSSPTISSDNKLFFGTLDGRVIALQDEGNSVRFLWKSPNILVKPVYASASLSYDKSIIYISQDSSTSENSLLYALRVIDGTKYWQYNIGGTQTVSTPAIAEDGTIYMGSTDSTKKLLALKPNSDLKWQMNNAQIDQEVWGSPVIGKNGIIYVVTQGDAGGGIGYLYAITDKGNYGQVEWEYELPSGYGMFSTPAIAEDGTIYVGSTDENIYAIKDEVTDEGIHSATKLWEEPLFGAIYGSPLIGGDGIIYVPAAGSLNAVYGTSPLCSDCTWPKFRHDNQNTANGNTVIQ